MGELEAARGSTADVPSRKLVAAVDTLVGSVPGIWNRSLWLAHSVVAAGDVVDSRERIWRATCWLRVKVEPQTGHLWSPPILNKIFLLISQLRGAVEQVEIEGAAIGSLGSSLGRRQDM